jgi:hypothetical protein
MKGIEEYETKSGIHVISVHYTADPSKDPSTPEGRDWLRKALKGYKGGMSSPDWRKEMEIDFRAKAGERVFQGLEEIKDRVFITPHHIHSEWKMDAGYDWGKRNPFAYLEIATDWDGKHYVCYEAYGPDYEIGNQASLIKKSRYKKQVNVRYADPSIWIENQVARDGSYTSLQNIFQEHGIIFAKGKTDDISMVDRLLSMWFHTEVDESGQVIRIPKRDPDLVIFQNCSNLWHELINLRWSDFSPGIEEERGKKEKIVQSDNHAFDALKYFLLSLPIPPERKKPPVKGLNEAVIEDLVEQQYGQNEEFENA